MPGFLYQNKIGQGGLIGTPSRPTLSTELPGTYTGMADLGMEMLGDQD